ncbi:hypothetical protein A2Z33_05075 [Candidatus Gottesmanbacteria bacterium RBG_16_52_11]|uniref:Uncharacterized protein n=1 Tax=Candidatus Gottesmanbacteria bacterium RBG_16_52_11 TaxID=1798374 RepID=A0A1F5YQN7_9BACT|nr:MAG: hypothetical protein A2Z33_05075 [Candidatus Gottesmanbacteria bacterium RBG_16_52_11]
MTITNPLTSLVIFTVALFSIILAFAIWGAMSSKGARTTQFKENLIIVFGLIRSYFVYLVIIALIALAFRFLTK